MRQPDASYDGQNWLLGSIMSMDTMLWEGRSHGCIMMHNSKYSVLLSYIRTNYMHMLTLHHVLVPDYRVET